MKRTWQTYVKIFFLIVGIDRLIKMWVMSSVYQPQQLTWWLAFTRSLNRGISFSLFSFNATHYYMLVSLAVLLLCLLLLRYAWRRWSDGHNILAETVVLAGAVSNLIDRVWYGGVVDFIELSYGSWVWPAFNVADMFIVVGLLVMCIKGYHEESR